MVIYMLIGFIFGTILISLLTSISDVISTYGELLKSRMLIKISENNLIIYQNNEAMENVASKEVIGFRIPIDEDEISI